MPTQISSSSSMQYWRRGRLQAHCRVISKIRLFHPRQHYLQYRIQKYAKIIESKYLPCCITSCNFDFIGEAFVEKEIPEAGVSQPYDFTSNTHCHRNVRANVVQKLPADSPGSSASIDGGIKTTGSILVEQKIPKVPTLLKTFLDRNSIKTEPI